MYIIIKSNSIANPNWSGKEFSSMPAKIYTSFLEATEAVRAYYYDNQDFGPYPDYKVTFCNLSEFKKEKLLAKGLIRW